MEKTINISGIETKFKSSAAVPRLYRIKFKRDIFADFSKMQKLMGKKKELTELPDEACETIENMAYIMAKYADPSQSDDIVEWLSQFETFDIYMVFGQIVELWNLDSATTSTPKKNKRQ